MLHALVILCGGLSTRMGTDKTFLPFGAATLIDYQIQRFQPFFEQIYLSVPAQKNRPVDYTARTGLPVIEDLFENVGPMGGLYSCLSAIPEDIVFFTSVDAPFTDPGLASDLCEQLAAAPEYTVCAIQDPNDRIQPLFAAYRTSCADGLKRAIGSGIYRMKHFLRKERVLIPDLFLPADQFFNMNDPSSYYYALHRLAQKNPGSFPADFAEIGAQTKEKTQIPVLSFTAKSGTGKTTYLEKLLPLLKQEHLRIAMIKHDAHGFEIDKPGKDSYRLTRAGADHMILTSNDTTAIILTHKGQPQEIRSIIRRIENVDFIITEGYKLADLDKIILLRKGYNETPVGSTENVIAYVTDFPYTADVPVFSLNRPDEIVPFLLAYIQKK